MSSEPEQLRFEPGPEIPNSSLPVLVYHGVSDAPLLFERHGWGGQWQDGVFPFHHFHSVSHEVLAVVAGSAVLALGGPQGDEVEVSEGDVLVLPAGTGHKRVSDRAGFSVAGAYPAGQEDYDLLRGDPAELEQAKRNIAAVALPEADPVAGPGGPLLRLWS